MKPQVESVLFSYKTITDKTHDISSNTGSTVKHPDVVYYVFSSDKHFCFTAV